MKPKRNWLPSALKAYSMLKDEHVRQAMESRQAVDRASTALARSDATLSEFCRAWASQRAALRTSHELEAAYLQFHAHLQRQQTELAIHHRELVLHFEQAQDRLRESGGKHRVLEQLDDSDRQHRTQALQKQALQQTAESWCLGQYGKGPKE